jgi:hypothetical protein
VGEEAVPPGRAVPESSHRSLGRVARAGLVTDLVVLLVDNASKSYGRMGVWATAHPYSHTSTRIQGANSVEAH